MKKTVAVDLDGVLAHYDGWRGVDYIGHPLPGAVEFTWELGKFARVLIYTTRCCEEVNEFLDAVQLKHRVKRWLNTHEFYFDDIWVGQGKPLYAALIDDRAVACEPQKMGQGDYSLAIERAKLLCEHAV